MNWIDDADRASRKIHERADAILQNADALYQSLWDEITTQIAQLREKGRDIKTNGGPLERILRMSVIPTGNQSIALPKECRIVLSPERDTISAKGGGVGIEFKIDVRDDGVVCLKHQDKEVRSAKAAELILYPFAYPELPPQ
jgi:hypothetical protein